MIQPPKPDLFFTKNDPLDPRWGELVVPVLDEQKKEWKNTDFALFGYPDDEGIQINGGRLGAALGPDEIRRFFYKMTPDLIEPNNPSLSDLGNISTDGTSLQDRHEYGRKLAAECLANNQRWIALGGGHDYAYCEASAFLDVFPENSIIINIDAHLDVRPLDRGLSSGTPFRRMLENYSGSNFDFFEVGIQSFCNSREHLKWALSHKQCHILFMEDIRQRGLQAELSRKLSELAGRPCYLSVDIDGFQASDAMGCSQSWAGGIRADEFFMTLAYLVAHIDIKALGIYEVSPPLDLDNRTSKLAAQIVEHYIRYQNRKDHL